MTAFKFRLLVISLSLLATLGFAYAIGSLQDLAAAHAEAAYVPDAALPAADAAPAPPAVTITTTTIAAEQLHDPLTNPAAAWSDLAALQRAGWPLLALGVLLMITHALARLPGAVGTWFATGLRATIVAGLGDVALAAFHALAIGGTWASVAFAAAGAALALFMPTPRPVRA